MAMTKAARMAMEMMRKSMPTKSMSQANAQRVEAAIRKNPKLYKGLAPSEVLKMLPPKGMTGKVVGTPITKGKRKKKATHELVYEDDKNYPTMKKINKKPTHELVYEDDKNYPTMKKIVTKKFVGGALKTIKKVGDAVKKKINKKDSKGNTVSILGKPSPNQIKTKKATKQQRTTRREKAKSFGKGVTTTTGIGLAIEGLKGKKSQTQSDPTPKTVKPFTPKSTAMPKPRPKKKMYMKERSGKDSNVEFAVGKAKKKLFGGGKVGGMKAGPATPNRLY